MGIFQKFDAVKDVKDEFSAQASLYARYRPHYPDALYAFLNNLTPEKEVAWDCGTGNGQVAARLAAHFGHVYATDISEKQLKEAPQLPNISYLQCRAEETPLPSAGISLTTVGQAIHWFDFDLFYKEVRRVSQPGAVIAVWTYNLLQITPEVDRIVRHLYSGILDGYWAFERRYVDEEYRTIPFPFEEIPAPAFEMKLYWRFSDLIGFLSSWSSVQQYIRQNGKSPLPEIEEALRSLWPEGGEKEVRFPIFMRAGRVGSAGNVKI